MTTTSDRMRVLALAASKSGEQFAESARRVGVAINDAWDDSQMRAHAPDDIMGDGSRAVCMHFIHGKARPVDWPCREFVDADRRKEARHARDA